MATNNATNKTADTFTATTSLATTFDTNVTAAGVTMAGTTIAADGTDANISITMTPKGTGTVNPAALSVNSAYTFPTTDGSANEVLTTDGAGGVTWESNSDIGTLVQTVYTQQTSVVTVNSSWALDNSIPQNTEGVEITTVTITPTSATNLLLIKAHAFGQVTTGTNSALAFFQDSTANALAATANPYASNTSWTASGTLMYAMISGTTSATTFKLRGSAGVGTWYVNGDSSATRLYGGVALAYIEVLEIEV